MPHDKNGEPLKVGDKVTVECEITSICEGEYCTTELKTVEVMPGNGQPTTISAINAKQLVKCCLVLLLMLLFGGVAAAADPAFTVVNRTGPRFVVVNRTAPAPPITQTVPADTLRTTSGRLIRLTAAGTYEYVDAAPAVAAPATFRTGYHAGHDCPGCGRSQYVISGFNRNGTHTHTCSACGQSWQH